MLSPTVTWFSGVLTTSAIVALLRQEDVQVAVQWSEEDVNANVTRKSLYAGVNLRGGITVDRSVVADTPSPLSLRSASFSRVPLQFY